LAAKQILLGEWKRAPKLQKFILIKRASGSYEEAQAHKLQMWQMVATCWLQVPTENFC
jgi:hypothetical protein